MMALYPKKALGCCLIDLNPASFAKPKLCWAEPAPNSTLSKLLEKFLLSRLVSKTGLFYRELPLTFRKPRGLLLKGGLDGFIRGIYWLYLLNRMGG